MARLDLSRIRDLIAAATDSGAAEVEIEEKGVRIVVRQQATQALIQLPYMVSPSSVPGMGMMPQSSPVQPGYVPQIVPPLPVKESVRQDPAEDPQEPEGTVVHAPIVGTFFRKPAPDAEPFVEVGSTVAVGDTLCIIEAMKNMNEVDSEVAGTVMQILVEDAEAVSYDQPLFVIA